MKGRDGGNLKGNYLSLISGLCLENNELIGKFKMAAGDILLRIMEGPCQCGIEHPGPTSYGVSS